MEDAKMNPTTEELIDDTTTRILNLVTSHISDEEKEKSIRGLVTFLMTMPMNRDEFIAFKNMMFLSFGIRIGGIVL